VVVLFLLFLLAGVAACFFHPPLPNPNPQLFEEAKLVTWPTPSKVASTTALVYAGMLGSAMLVLGVDTAAITLGQKVGFVYGKNPDAVKSRFKLPAIFDPGAANQVQDPSPFPKANE
jgi:hypothetical protein